MTHKVLAYESVHSHSYLLPNSGQNITLDANEEIDFKNNIKKKFNVLI